MKTLATCTAAVAASWGVLYMVPAPIPPATAIYDKVILYAIGGIFTMAALVMLISRRTWTLRAIGLGMSILGISVIAWNAVYTRQVGYTTRNGRVVSAADPGIQEAISDLWRALFIIGGPLLFIGLSAWVYGRFGPHTEDPIFGERRKTVRREDDRNLLARVAELEQRQT